MLQPRSIRERFLVTLLAGGLCFLVGCGSESPSAKKLPKKSAPETPSGFPPSAQKPPKETGVALVVTGLARGLIQPCGCDKNPAGGLARRAALHRLLQSSGYRPIAIETGNSLSIRNPARMIFNQAMGEFWKNNGPALVGLGEWDLQLPTKDRRALAEKGFSFYSCTANPSFGGGSTEAKILPSAEILVGGGPDRVQVVFVSEGEAWTSAFNPVEPTLTEYFKKNPPLPTLLVGVLSPKTVKAILGHKDWPLVGIAASWKSTVTSKPQRAGRTWVTYTGDRARWAVVFNVEKGGKDGKGLRFKPPSVIFLGPKAPSDPVVDQWVKGVVEKANVKNKEGILGFAKDPKRDDRRYLGEETCASCHEKEAEIWSQSNHSRAFKHLAIDHQENNPDCVKCHTTGFSKAFGFVRSDKTPTLHSVQCEACHGPGENHPGKTLLEVTEQTCRRCHTQQESPAFNFEEYWGKIRHGKKGDPVVH